MFSTIIAPGLSPNTEDDDILRSWSLLWKPSAWFEGSSISAVERWFHRYFNTPNVCLFSSGRCAFYALLKAFAIGDGDEVIIQAFTCVAVPEAILEAGAVPVYADINPNTYNIDPGDVAKKITPKTRAIVLQHTFGVPANVSGIQRLVRRKKIVVIEDCAHALGATIKKQKVGTLGDASFFSFGRDKIVSCVSGGAALVSARAQHRSAASALSSLHKAMPYPSRFWIVQHLLHPVLFRIILPLYTILNIGKVLLFISQKAHLLSLPVAPLEYSGKMPASVKTKLPNAQAAVVLLQLSKLYRFNVKRRLIAKSYGTIRDGAVYLSYPLKLPHTQSVYLSAKKKGIVLGTWYESVVAPEKVDLDRVGYRKGSCPQAERVAGGLVNLPTYPRMRDRDVQRVCTFLQNMYDT